MAESRNHVGVAYALTVIAPVLAGRAAEVTDSTAGRNSRNEGAFPGRFHAEAAGMVASIAPEMNRP